MEREFVFEDVVARARVAFGVKNDAQLCQLLGFSSSAFANRKKSGSIPFAELIEAAHSRKVSLDALFFDEPPLHVNAQKKRIKARDEVELVHVPYYDAVGSCGAGSWIDSATVIETVPYARAWLVREGLNPDNTVIIGSRGDSMYPVITSGERLLLDRSKTDTSMGGIFAFVFQGELSIKYAQRAEGGLLISSENAERFPPRLFTPAETQQIVIEGQVRIGITRL